MDRKIECTQEVLELMARSVANVFAGLLRNTNKIKIAENDKLNRIVSLTNYVSGSDGLLMFSAGEIEALKTAVYEAFKIFQISESVCQGNLILKLYNPVYKLLNKLNLQEETEENKKIKKACNLFVKLKNIDSNYAIDERYKDIFYSFGYKDEFLITNGNTTLCTITFSGEGMGAGKDSMDEDIISASDVFFGRVYDPNTDKITATLLYMDKVAGRDVLVTPGILGKIFKIKDFRKDERHVIIYMPLNDFLNQVGLTSLIKKSYNAEERVTIRDSIQVLTRLGDEELGFLPIAAKIASDWWVDEIRKSLTNSYHFETPTEEQLEILRSNLMSNIIFKISENPRHFIFNPINRNSGALIKALEKAGIKDYGIPRDNMSVTSNNVSLLEYGKEPIVLYDGTENVNKNSQL